MNKKGVIGSFSVTFVATIIIVILLVVMILISASIRELTNAKGEVAVQEEDSLGIEKGVGYMENYGKLVEARSSVSEKVSLNDALLEVGYEE